MANAVIAKDVEKGVPEAIMLQGKVSRKVVKQTVRRSFLLRCALARTDVLGRHFRS
jgi:hypothetical protein